MRINYVCDYSIAIQQQQHLGKLQVEDYTKAKILKYVFFHIIN